MIAQELKKKLEAAWHDHGVRCALHRTGWRGGAALRLTYFQGERCLLAYEEEELLIMGPGIASLAAEYDREYSDAR